MIVRDQLNIEHVTNVTNALKIDTFHFKTGGQLNTELFKKVYAVFSVTMAFFTLPSWLSSVAFYPVNENVIGKNQNHTVNEVRK